MRYALLSLLLIIALPAQALTSPDEKLNNPALEARAQKLTEDLRCVVCQNESIADSAADIALDLRLLVRKQILDGKTDAQILDFLHARYGDYIFFKPPLDARTWLLWCAPLIVLSAGGILAFVSFKRRRR